MTNSEPIRKTVTIWTDGSCVHTKAANAGGYAALLRYNGTETLLRGQEFKVTSSGRMELMAVILGVKALKKPAFITVVSDCSFVTNGLTRLEEWKGQGFKQSSTSTKRMIPEHDLWARLWNAIDAGQHLIRSQWCRGHNGNKNNVRVDKAALRQARLALKGENGQ